MKPALLQRVVCFRVGEREFAIEIETIIEIVYYRPATPLPDAPDFIEGVIDLREQIIPVIDLRKRLHALDGGVSEHIVIVRVADQMLGLNVDAVTEVAYLDPQQLQAPQRVLKATVNRYLRGVSRYKNRLVFVLDLSRLLDHDEQILLDGMKS